MNMKQSTLALALGMAIAVTGCNSSSSKSYGSSGKLNGTAAVGAAISGGIVEARCKDTSGDNDFIGTVTTDANGKWSAKLKTEATLPCAIRVKWGNPQRTLHSYAYDYGTINITPLTDIILTAAASQKLDDVWFGVGMGSTPTNIAEDEVLAAFKDKGYSVPNGSPFTTAFNANGTGWDFLLDQLKEAIPNYDAFLDSVILGGIAGATIPDAPEAPVGAGNSEILGNNSGVTALFNGERKTSFRFKDSYRGTPVGAGVGYASLGDDQYTFEVRISGISSFVNGGVNCNANGIPSVNVAIDGVFYSGTNCVVTTTAVTDTLTAVSFSGTLDRMGEHATAPATLEITDGEFQYVAKPFATSNGVPQVFASFEGITPSANGNSVSNVAVSAGDIGWAYDWKQIIAVDVSNNPLSVTPANGETLSGGNTAVTLLSNTNILSGEFDNDAYVSLLLRVKQPAQGYGLLADQKIFIGNAGIYIGLDGTSFVASIGDNQNEKASFGNFEHSTTYHLVARLYKSQGSDHFDRLEYWLDPARNASAVPTGTVSRTSSNSGNMKLINYLGSYSSATKVTIDRIVASTTWDGLFTGAAEEPGNGDPTTGNDPLNGKDGATATVNGTAITYAESASWTIGVFRRSSFIAVGSSNAKQWQIVDYMVDTNSPKTQHCGDGVYPLQLIFWDGANIAEATSCTVTIDDYGTYSVSGSFTAVFPKSKVFGSETTITDGYFQKIAQYTNGGGGTLEPGVDGATFKVDGKEYRYVNSRAPDPVSLNSGEPYYAVEFDATAQEQMHPGNPVGMSIKVLPLTAGTYACGHEFTPWRMVQLPFYWKDEHYTATDCSITLTTAEADVFEGSFSGTFKNPSESKTINVTDGKFRASR